MPCLTEIPDYGSQDNHRIESADINKPLKKVYVVMVADLFHYGHVEFLKRARRFGDYLIADILSDQHVQGYKRLPIMSLQERMRLVAACRYVDEVIEHKQLADAQWYQQMGIDVRVHALGSEAERQRKAGRPFRPGLPPRYEVPYEPGISTSEIIQRIYDRTKDENV